MSKKYTQDEIDELIRLHELWLYSSGGEGKRLLIYDADLSGLDLSEKLLRFSGIINCNLSNINFDESNFNLALIRNCNITNSTFRHSNLDSSSIENCDITGSNMYCCCMVGTKFEFKTGKEIFQFCMGKHHGHYVDGYIMIGCRCYTVEYWLENYRKIGEDVGYSIEEIEIYGNMIKYIYKKFVKKSNGNTSNIFRNLLRCIFPSI